MNDRPLRFLALGDSASVGVGASDGVGFPERLARRLKAAGRPVGFLNLALSGATSSQVIAQAERAVAKEPDVVSLAIGGNDAWRLVPEDEFARNLRRILASLAKTSAEVVVSTIPDLGLAPAAAIAQAWLGITPALVTQRVASLNRRLVEVATGPRVTVVDVFALTRDALAKRSDLFCADGFHPSASGYDAWADALWPAVEAAARRRAEASSP